MILLVAALCDAATDYGGKLNILGAFDTIFATKLPVVHPNCAVALRMSFNKFEEGHHEVRVDVVNDDGAPLGPPMQVPLQIEVPDEIEAVSRNIIINIQNWQFGSEGNFALNVSVDGRHETSIPLRVVLAKNQSATGQVGKQDGEGGWKNIMEEVYSDDESVEEDENEDLENDNDELDFDSDFDDDDESGHPKN